MKRIRSFLSHRTSVDVIINTFGNYLNVFFTALYFLVLVRVLSRTEYGVLSVLFAIAYVLANILDFGVTASIYSHLPNAMSNRTEALKFLKANFIFQFILSSSVLVVLFFFIKPIDHYILKLDVPLSYYFWTFLTIPLFIMQNFALNVLYATKKFLYANIIVNTANIIKTIILFVLIWKGRLSVLNVIITIGFIGQVVFIGLLFLQRRNFFKELLATKIDRGKIFLRYTLTFFAATQLFTLASRIDLFMLSFFLPKALVGDYGLSQKIILTVLTAVSSITQVLSPQFSNIHDKTELLRLLKKSFVYMIIPISLFCIAIIAPNWIYLLFLPEKWTQAIAITRTLSIPYIIYSLTAIPTLFFLYTIKKPLHLLIMNGIFLVIITIGCYLTIPQRGVFGPPPVLMIGFVVVLFYILFAFVLEFRKLFRSS